MATANTAIVLSASRTQIIKALAQFKNKEASAWLPAGHPCPTGAILNAGGRPLRSFPTFLANFSNAQTAVLLAAVAPNHCLDGWSYFSRAMEALVSGDMHAARHLSYYAQLRAAMSILAFSGVGIFNGLNFVIDRTGRRTQVLDGKGTHSAVWEALEAWAAQSTPNARFFDVIALGGVPISDSIQAIWPGALVSEPVRDFIHSWGLDLKKGATDHDFRNISSYNPHQLNGLTCSAKESLEFVERIWDILEPASGDGFDKLDRHLLRATLQAFHRLVSPDKSVEDEEAGIPKRFNQLDPRLSAFVSKDFLTGAIDPEPLAIMDFANNKPNGDPLGMLSRGLLLLRMATGFARTSFSDAGYKHLDTELRPWLSNVGEQRGLWDPDSEPNSMIDLWEDIRVALDDLEPLRLNPPSNLFSLFEGTTTSLRNLMQSERAFLWGVGA